eukprot:TRINITY_DN761_c0_g1_i3.p1 TRINITY_DN761_c0_g1~~TRINITY_DN761_c0_g1_i3.p1  ORF type:complete len:233 (+),score=31.07 TRINITY_DN761_c0_g1_i3:349-1047(+)
MDTSLKKLYAGAASPLAFSMVHNANIFFWYGLGRSLVEQDDVQDRTFAKMVVFPGVISGMASSVTNCVMDLYKCKMQAQIGTRYKSSYDCAKDILKTQGIRGAFQGFFSTMIRNTTSFPLYFIFYETSMSLTTKPGREPSLFDVGMAGSLAGFGFWGILYPFDFVKTKLQVQDTSKGKLYNGFIDCWKKTVQQEGYRALFRGYFPCLLRAIPVNGAIFLGVHITKEFVLRHV